LFEFGDLLVGNQVEPVMRLHHWHILRIGSPRAFRISLLQGWISLSSTVLSITARHLQINVPPERPSWWTTLNFGGSPVNGFIANIPPRFQGRSFRRGVAVRMGDEIRREFLEISTRAPVNFPDIDDAQWLVAVLRRPRPAVQDALVEFRRHATLRNQAQLEPAVAKLVDLELAQIAGDLTRHGLQRVADRGHAAQCPVGQESDTAIAARRCRRRTAGSARTGTDRTRPGPDRRYRSGSGAWPGF